MRLIRETIPRRGWGRITNRCYNIGMRAFVSGIVLAAGESKRMGRPKLLLPFGDATVIERTVTAVAGSGLGEVIMVTGHQAERLPPGYVTQG